MTEGQDGRSLKWGVDDEEEVAANGESIDDHVSRASGPHGRAGSGAAMPPDRVAPPAASHERGEPDSGNERFDRPDAHKIGIIGGKGVGKSYLFQSIVYRTVSGQHSGALTYFLEKDSTRLVTASADPMDLTRTGTEIDVDLPAFVSSYRSWRRLGDTKWDHQKWYRLSLRFRTGWLGRARSSLDVEFFDGSGEGFFVMPAMQTRALWLRAYGNATVMVFCLPIWAAFPGPDLTAQDRLMRQAFITEFARVVNNFKSIQTSPVTTILALTMADDDRSGLRTLRDRWIMPYLHSAHTYLKELGTGSGVARYLRNAREVSEALHDEFSAARDPLVARIRTDLDCGGGLPWIVPLSATDGRMVDEFERRAKQSPNDASLLGDIEAHFPTPVHVELPLLVALCDRDNALM